VVDIYRTANLEYNQTSGIKYPQKFTPKSAKRLWRVNSHAKRATAQEKSHDTSGDQQKSSKLSETTKR
jgi:hypothetical protein